MRLEKEYAAQVSIQVGLKRELHQEREGKHNALEKFKAVEQEARRDRAEFETTINILRRDLDTSRHTERLSEARCGDLQVALSLERERFDDAVGYEREILTGMRDRFGLIPKAPRDVSEGGPQAIQTRRQPWDAVKDKLESKSRQQSQAGKEAKVDNDKLAEHYKTQIEKIEESDKELGITDGNSSTDNSEKV